MTGQTSAGGRNMGFEIASHCHALLKDQPLNLGPFSTIPSKVNANTRSCSLANGENSLWKYWVWSYDNKFIPQAHFWVCLLLSLTSWRKIPLWNFIALAIALRFRSSISPFDDDLTHFYWNNGGKFEVVIDRVTLLNCQAVLSNGRNAMLPKRLKFFNGSNPSWEPNCLTNRKCKKELNLLRTTCHWWQDWFMSSFLVANPLFPIPTLTRCFSHAIYLATRTSWRTEWSYATWSIKSPLAVWRRSKRRAPISNWWKTYKGQVRKYTVFHTNLTVCHILECWNNQE